MSFISLILAISSVALLSVGQLLMKVFANSLNHQTMLSAVLSWPLIGALSAYGLSLILWFLVLKNTPLKMAYPVAGLAFVIVPMLAYLFLNEPLSWRSFVGAGLIATGIVISTH